MSLGLRTLELAEKSPLSTAAQRWVINTARTPKFGFLGRDPMERARVTCPQTPARGA